MAALTPVVRRTGAAVALALFAALVLWALWPRPDGRAFVLRQASPGALAPAHAFLGGDCSACHAPMQSVPAAQCVACHADEKPLLQRQPTAFHADVGSCRECHKEHRGLDGLRAPMDHDALVRIGLQRLRLARNQTPEVPLDCAACHSTKDRHRGLFGNDCSACHATSAWQVAAFRHPSPQSRECAQCHRAPPSHYMEHFAMVSQRIARREHAGVRECFECHRTTSWNDIQGVGLHKHH